MRMPRSRFTIGRLMVVVALACVALAASRVHLLLGLYAGGVLALTVIRVLPALDWCEARQRNVTALEGIALWLGSLSAGLACMTMALLACIPGAVAGAAATLWLLGAWRAGFFPDIVGMMVGLIAFVAVLYRLRRSYLSFAPWVQVIFAPDPPPLE